MPGKTENSSGRSVIKELMCLSNLVKRSLDAARAERNDSTTPMHGFIIGYISRNRDRDIFQKDIETKFSYRRSTASTVLGLMEEKGLIKREPVPYDARLKKLVLTEKAESYAASCEEDGERLDAEMTKGITGEEMDALFSTLDKIRCNLKGGN